MALTHSQSVAKYKAKTYKRFLLELRLLDDRDIIEFVYSKGNTNKYLRDLVRADMAKERNGG